MQLEGLISKMQTELIKGVAHYKLPIGDKLIDINSLIGEKISLEFTGAINCNNCNRKIKKSYFQGYCYPCSQILACCDFCILKPETCHYHLGTCREPKWGQDNCFKPHIVYLANSSTAKVGITRKSNIPSRWIDQGAIDALPILQIDNRLKSGQIELELKKYINDKTNWRKMLKNENDDIELTTIKQKLIAKIEHLIIELKADILDYKPVKINYPVLKYPSTIKSLSFDKTPNISGILNGIKAQYLILDNGILNIRKFSSYNVRLMAP